MTDGPATWDEALELVATIHVRALRRAAALDAAGKAKSGPDGPREIPGLVEDALTGPDGPPEPAPIKWKEPPPPRCTSGGKKKAAS